RYAMSIDRYELNFELDHERCELAQHCPVETQNHLPFPPQPTLQAPCLYELVQFRIFLIPLSLSLCLSFSLSSRLSFCLFWISRITSHFWGNRICVYNTLLSLSVLSIC